MPDTSSTHKAPFPSWQTFAWNGIAFPVPCDWNLASYHMDRHAFHAILEDDVAVRLEIEWERAGRKPPDLDKLVRRAERRLRKLRRAAVSVQTLDGVPDNWRVQFLDMPDGRRLVVSIGHLHDAGLTALLRFHFDTTAPANLEIARRVIAGSHFDNPVAARWQVYDCAFRVHPEFRLQSTEFVAGRKLFVFDWRRRVLSIWFVSFADRAMRYRSLAQWSAAFLNQQPTLRGPHFTPDGAERLSVTRARGVPLSHYAELLRGCLRYHTVLHRIPAANQIAVAVFQYRRNEDLRMLQEFEQSLR
jgi:hypothetical protein